MHLNGDATQAQAAVTILEYTVGAFPIKYLELLLHVGNLHKDDWLVLMSQIDKRLGRWKGQLLSRARRLMLINSTINAALSYMLSIFKVPNWVIKKIECCRHKFFWFSSKFASCREKCLIK